MFRLLAVPSELTTECTAVHAQHFKDGFSSCLVVGSLRMDTVETCSSKITWNIFTYSVHGAKSFLRT